MSEIDKDAAGTFEQQWEALTPKERFDPDADHRWVEVLKKSNNWNEPDSPGEITHLYTEFGDSITT